MTDNTKPDSPIWRETTLNRLGVLRTGNLRNKFASNFLGSKVNYVTQFILNGELYVEKQLEHFSHEHLRNNLFPIGTVCINVDKSVGSILREPSYLHENVIAFSPFENACDSKFIKYYLEFSEVRSNFYDLHSLTKVNTVTIERLRNIPFSSPQAKFQQIIGTIIEAYDLLLINYEKQICLLKEMREYLFLKYFRGNCFPLGKIKNFVFSEKGKSKAEDAFHKGVYPLFTYSSLVKKTNKCDFNKEALVLCLNSDNKYIEYFSGKFSALREINILSCIKPKLIYWILEYIRYLFSRKRKVNIMNLELFAPPRDLLDSFNELVEPVQKKINNLTRQIDLLNNAKIDLIEEIYSQRLKINAI